MHDDIWFWGDKDSTVKAWQIIQQFTNVMGLRLNDAKTGAIELDGVPVSARQLGFSEGLPAGPITWGFLKIGPSGKWMIADKQVEAHVKELQLQLQACKSILAWVQAWSAYAARYLSNNLGEPSNCLGRPHLDLVIETFDNIQSRVFAADGLSGGNVIEHLRGKLRTRFGVIDIPDGFFLFPIELGGLGLVNPLVRLSGVYKESLKDPGSLIEKAWEEDELEYQRARRVFVEGTSPSRNQTPDNYDTFMDLDEFMKYREETSESLYRAYKGLIDAPSQSLLETTPDVSGAKEVLPLRRGWYEEWILELYGPDIIRRYGGLAMGDKRLLPIGLTSMLRREKVRWQG